jgi:hypothetical protein
LRDRIAQESSFEFAGFSIGRFSLTVALLRPRDDAVVEINKGQFAKRRQARLDAIVASRPMASVNLIGKESHLKAKNSVFEEDARHLASSSLKRRT